MHCTSCSTSVDWELEDLPGVEEARTSYADGTSDVSYDPAQVTEHDIIEAIGRAGFEAAPA
jgi:copper chaperone CopZ